MMVLSLEHSVCECGGVSGGITIARNFCGFFVFFPRSDQTDIYTNSHIYRVSLFELDYDVSIKSYSAFNYRIDR